MPNQSVISVPKKTKIFFCHDKPCSKKRHRLKKLMSLFPMAKRSKVCRSMQGPVVLVVKDKERFYCKQIKKKKGRNNLWDFIVLGVHDKKAKYKRKKKKVKLLKFRTGLSLLLVFKNTYAGESRGLFLEIEAILTGELCSSDGIHWLRDSCFFKGGHLCKTSTSGLDQWNRHGRPSTFSKTDIQIQKRETTSYHRAYVCDWVLKSEFQQSKWIVPLDLCERQ